MKRSAAEIFNEALDMIRQEIASLGHLRDNLPAEHAGWVAMQIEESLDVFFKIQEDSQRV